MLPGRVGPPPSMLLLTLMANNIVACWVELCISHHYPYEKRGSGLVTVVEIVDYFCLPRQQQLLLVTLLQKSLLVVALLLPLIVAVVPLQIVWLLLIILLPHC